jgi:hypothetical protein
VGGNPGCGIEVGTERIVSGGFDFAVTVEENVFEGVAVTLEEMRVDDVCDVCDGCDGCDGDGDGDGDEATFFTTWTSVVLSICLDMSPRC